MLQNFLDELLAGQAKFDVRPFHLLEDHKLLMRRRLKYLGDIGILKNYKMFQEEYTNFAETMFFIKAQVLLFKNNESKAIINDIKIKLQKLANQEKAILLKLINVLEKH